MRSGPQPKDVGCADIVAGKTPNNADTTLPPPPQPTIANGDAATAAAITRAADALTDLKSYQFSVDVVGRDLTTLQSSTFDFAIRGTVDRSTDFAVDAILGTRLREGNGSGAVASGGHQIKAGHGLVWETDNVSEVLEPSRSSGIFEKVTLVTPEGSAARFVVPFGAGYRRIGAEPHEGVATIHYRAMAKGVAAYSKTLQFRGPMNADVWVAADGGHLVAAHVGGNASHKDATTGIVVDDSFIVAFEVSHPNDPANVVTLPAAPVPDPPRPTKAPVDLQLTLRVLPDAGKAPTAVELDEIGVALRTRLNVYERPVKVDVSGLDKIIVTVCRTTTPDEDRRLTTSAGALTVVPLPRDRFGTVASPGPEELPAVGSTIDPGLEPIAPASGLGLTTAHVDPTTGQRGLAFYLGNAAAENFKTYAAVHRNEFVAIVLDGTVLAPIPIDDRTARGNFVFTGDYTEAESRNLASYLYRDPIAYDLRLIEDIEIPARGG